MRCHYTFCIYVQYTIRRLFCAGLRGLRFAVCATWCLPQNTLPRQCLRSCLCPFFIACKARHLLCLLITVRKAGCLNHFSYTVSKDCTTKTFQTMMCCCAGTCLQAP